MMQVHFAVDSHFQEAIKHRLPLSELFHFASISPDSSMLERHADMVTL